jgi:peptide/nickel transport system substrate-binding protein
MGTQAEENIEKHLYKRFENLLPVRRFVLGWAGLLIILLACVIAQNLSLSGYYQTLKPVPGGVYSEGVLGRFTNANPIYATTEADTTVSKLVFAGLFYQDTSGILKPELADNYSVNAKGTIFTVKLKSNIRWQDGQPLTASDVAFTFNTIKNPDALSPLLSGWTGVNITTPDSHTIVFTLPDALASFPYGLTTGILPRHLLKDVPPASLRSADFNTINMVGSGAFALKSLSAQSGTDPNSDRQEITLTPFNGYVDGPPKLDTFVVQVFANQIELNNQFKNGQLTAMEAINAPSSNILHKQGVISNSLLFRAANMVFFKDTSGVLADQNVRKAIVSGTNVPEIVSKLDYVTPLVTEPLLRGQLAYDPAFQQAKYDASSSISQLKADGWIKGKNGLLTKNNTQLTFTLTVADNPENHIVASDLQSQWRKLGINAQLLYVDNVDFQNALKYHSYDAILNGISIGIDPDVFVYWNSNQANIGSGNALNFSEFKNATADSSLEAGRTRINPTLRIIKYKPFLSVWQQSAPALGLYQPRLLYLTNTYVSGLQTGPIVSSSDRFNNVQNWEIRQARVTIN